MNSAFIPDDSARLGAAGGAAYAPVDASGIPLLDHQHSHQHPQPAARFSSASDSRNQTPAAKRTREDEESDGNESDGNSRGKEGSQTTEKRAGRRKIKIEYIEDKSRRHITFSKRKAGIMKKAYELSTLTGTQVLLLVVSETGLVYTFTTPKLQPIVTQPEGKNLIQTCLNVPDTPGERVTQPVPTESNSYMSQPRPSQAHNYANSAAAAAVAAAAVASNSAAMMGGGGAAVNHDLHHGLSEDQHTNIDSPATAAAVAAASNTAHTPYLQYPYGQNAVAQAAAAVAAAAGTPGAYHPGVVSQTANGVNYTPVPGYTASYPGSTSQSQHHSPIPGALSHTPNSAGGNNSNGISAAVAAATSSVPGMNSLNSYHHGYGHPHAQHQQQQQQNHYSYQPHHHQPQSQYQYHGHSQQHDLSQGSAPGTPLEQSPAGSAAVAAAVAAAAGGHASGSIGGSIQTPGNITTSYMAANHYWSPGAIASPHPGQQQAQQPTSATGLVQRTGYASGN
ncbi:transcription factor of the MADS box [Coemansia interrupta]|uniref:Transcription factor of the MADS box n=1 Tax=Coemansia interrupta TaxID=1126814 RepID=A0A9W8HMC0_9FUNG|nr:transcription factor of the MADS box [Coemansia interrupta]